MQPDETGQRAGSPAVDEERRVVAVTGAAGLLGSELIQAMEDDRRYHKILAIDIRKPAYGLAKTQFHRIDLTLPTADTAVASVLSREGADTVVHLAFLSEFTQRTEMVHELESVGTMHVLNACAECGIPRFVIWSLTACYGAQATNPNFIVEETPLVRGPDVPFAERVDADRQAGQFKLEHPDTTVTVLRTAPVVGPRIQNYATGYLKRRFVPTLAGFDPLVQLLHEEDAVEAFKLAVDLAPDGVFNIVSRGLLPLHTVLAVMGRVPIPLPHLAAYPAFRFLWATQLGQAPPEALDFLRFLCVADGHKAASRMGWVARYHIHDILASLSGMKLSGAESTQTSEVTGTS